jgi:DNA-directed RNA polymerase specialized sigma24 family protein
MIHAYALPQIRTAEQQVVSLLKSKHKEGFELFYETYSKFIYIISLRITGNTSLAMQALENTCIYIWKNIDSYTPSNCSFGVWLVWIVKQEAFKLTHSPIS